MHGARTSLRTQITAHRPDIHFISRESFDIFLILCDSLVQLIFVYREFHPTYPLLPWLHSTEMLEHFFGIMRKLKADFNFADALWLEPKLRTLVLGAFKNLSPEEQAKATAAGYWHTYLHAPDLDEAALRTWLTNTQFADQARHGLHDAVLLLDYLGIDALEMLRTDVSPAPTPAYPPTRVEELEIGQRPIVTLHDILNRLHPVAPISSEQENALEMTQYALAAQSTESTLNMYASLCLAGPSSMSNDFCSMDLPDASPEEIDELRASIAHVLEGVVLVCCSLSALSLLAECT